MTEPAAGWYPDPAGRPDCYRWWDGAGWTRDLTEDPSAAEPEHAPDPGVDFDPTEPPIGVPATTRTTYPPGYLPAHRPARAAGGRSPMRGLAIGIALVVVLALAALSAVVLLERRDGDDLRFPEPAGAAGPSSSPTPTPTPIADGATYEAETRELILPGMSLTMPGDPYDDVVIGDPLLGTLLDGAHSWAVVQEDYQESGSDWSAELRVGKVADQWTGKDVAKTGNAVFDRILDQSYGGDDAKVTKKQSKTYTEGYPYPVRIVSADVHYRIKGVDSRFDFVSILVTPRPDGGYNAWYSRRPNNAEPEVKKAIEDSIGTIQLS